MTAVDDGAGAGLTARDHALRVGLTDALVKTAKLASGQARGEAEALFAGLREDGQPQQKVLLPSGEEIGLISIKDGGTLVEVNDESAFEAWVRDHIPDGIEEYVDPGAIANADLVDMVRAMFPHLVRTGIRASVRKALVDEMTNNGGAVADKATGEKTVLATVTRGKPTGAFAYRPKPGATEKVISEWLAGRLPADLGGVLALQAGRADDE